MLPEIKELRKQLHQHPDLSGEEACTAGIIRDFADTHSEAEIITGLGGHGVALIHSFSEEGPVIMIRCELDALPIEETNDFPHRSLKEGISHKCGHDGHMSIVAGLLLWLINQSFKSGKVILLFQPAEETGKGAFKVLNDPNFKNLTPDYIFALHNLPGEPLNSIVAVEKAFSSTVQSLSIHLNGKQSHASEPEKGKNPASVIAGIIFGMSELNIPAPESQNFTLLTPVYLKMGEKDYGISPGNGELHYTIRTRSEKALDALKEKITSLVKSVSSEHGLLYGIKWFDHFPATVNNPECNEMIKDAAAKNGYDLIIKSHPFKFGEDFGWFSKHTKAAMFGIGAGINSPALHHSDYDFPDEILETGINMFSSIIKKILGPSKKA